MDLELRGKVAVVTGASVGIGREIAKVLASEGVQTAVTARRANLLATLVLPVLDQLVVLEVADRRSRLDVILPIVLGQLGNELEVRGLVHGA